MGGNFKFQVQDSFLEYFLGEIWRFEKRVPFSEKKPPLPTPSTTLNKMQTYQQFVPDPNLGSRSQ